MVCILYLRILQVIPKKSQLINNCAAMHLKLFQKCIKKEKCPLSLHCSNLLKVFYRRCFPYGSSLLTDVLSLSSWEQELHVIKICGILSILNQLYLLISSGNTLPLPLCSGITFSDGSSGWALILEDKLFLLFSESHRFTLSPVIFRLMSMTIFCKVAQVFWCDIFILFWTDISQHWHRGMSLLPASCLIPLFLI